MKQKNKKRKALKIILLIIGIIILTLTVAVAAICIPLLINFYNISFEHQPPVERTDEYVMPAYPVIETDLEISWIPEDETDPDETLEYIETDPPVITAEETTTSPEVTTAPPPETTQPPETTHPETTAEQVIETTQLPETLPKVENTNPIETAPPAQTARPAETVKTPETTVKPKPVQTQEPESTNSFANTTKSISVYGKTPIYVVKQKDPNIVNILVMGTDSRDVTKSRGRSDTMIIVSYNQKTGEVKLTSLLRDALVPIEGYDWNRINTAYLNGGVGLAINTVNQLFDLDIQQFIVVDLNGVRNFIDYIGGVKLKFTQAEVDLYNLYWGTSYTAGTYDCDAKMVMTHLRNRSVGSDFDRTRRQQDVVIAIATKILKEKTLTEIYDIVNYSFGLVKTNISATKLISYATSVVGNASKLDISTQQVPYRDSFKYAWYKGKAIISFDISKAASRINKFIYG